MIYLDTTSACLSRLNTGIKRMQRSLHSLLKSRPDYQPVCWQSAWRTYRELTPADRAILEEPFAQKVAENALLDTTIPGLLSDWTRAVSHRSLLLHWPREMQAGDVLLVPDLLWDNRGGFFRKVCPAGVRRIAIFHDAISLRFPRQSRLDVLLSERAIRAMARFDEVICISHEAEADLQLFWKKFGEKPAPTCVLPWPVPFSEARPQSMANFEAREILFVARLEPYKNHAVLFEACRMLWQDGLDFKLRLIGCKAYPEQSRRILESLEALRAAGRDALWQGYVSDEELHEAYRRCSFTAFPSLLEGFGLPIIESLWHGRPVVCDGKGAIGEIAAGGGCETVDVEAPHSLAEALRRLLTDRAHYERLHRETQTRTYRSWEEYWTELRPHLGLSL